MVIGGVLMLILWLVILGAIAWFVENYAPMPAPFRMLVRVVIIIVAILLLVNFFIGFGPPPTMHR